MICSVSVSCNRPVEWLSTVVASVAGRGGWRLSGDIGTARWLGLRSMSTASRGQTRTRADERGQYQRQPQASDDRGHALRNADKVNCNCFILHLGSRDRAPFI